MIREITLEICSREHNDNDKEELDVEKCIGIAMCCINC